MSQLAKLPSRDSVELAICYGLILWAIWTSRPTQHFLFWVTFAWIVATTVLRRPDAKTLGLWPSDLRSWLWIAAGGIIFAGLVVGIAFWMHTVHPLLGASPVALHIAGYLLWAFEQQFILQNYFLFRLLRILPGGSAAIAIAGVLFSLAHLPNPVLTAVTLAWGVVSCALFWRYRNVYALGFVHGMLGLSVAISLPDTITHHMMVGLGYLHYHR